jgi:hypothetical protein
MILRWDDVALQTLAGTHHGFPQGGTTHPQESRVLRYFLNFAAGAGRSPRVVVHQLYESLENFYKTFFPHEGVDLGRCTNL